VRKAVTGRIVFNNQFKVVTAIWFWPWVWKGARQRIRQAIVAEVCKRSPVELRPCLVDGKVYNRMQQAVERLLESQRMKDA